MAASGLLTLPVAQNSFKKLPRGRKFLVTMDLPTGEGDGDVWFVRKYFKEAHKPADVLSWYTTKYEREDLGSNSQGNPFLAWPQLDLITEGDDRNGTESEVRYKRAIEAGMTEVQARAAAYDEGGTLDLSKAPQDVEAYFPALTVYDHDDEGLRLGIFSQLSFVIVDLKGNTRYATQPAATDPTALCFVPGSIRRSAPDSTDWEMHGVTDEDARGTDEDVWRVCNRLGANLPTP